MFPVGDPGNPQKVAAAATYGLRVNLCQLLALVGRDDDGHQGTPPGANPIPVPPPHHIYTPGPAQQPAAWPAPGQQVQAPPATYPAAQPQQQAPQGPPADPYSNVLPNSAWVPPAAPAPAPSPYV
jgi:hypothetical protein